MVDLRGVKARLLSRLSAGRDRLARAWSGARVYLSSLRIAWVALASLLVGAVMLVVAKQGQDLFLDVRGGFAVGTAYWVAFYLSFILFWVAPVYVSARWILSRVDAPAATSDLAREQAAAFEDHIPRYLATACFGLLLVGQVSTIVDAPYVIDATNTVRDPKNEIILILVVLFALFCIFAFARRLLRLPRGMADAAAWRSNLYALLLTLAVLLLALNFGAPLKGFMEMAAETTDSFFTILAARFPWMSAGNGWYAQAILVVAMPASLVLGYALSFLPWRWLRILCPLAIAVPSLVLILPATLLIAAILARDLKARILALAEFEIDAPLGIGHLAILPVVTFVLGCAALHVLKPGGRVRAAVENAAERLLPRPASGLLSKLDVAFALLVVCTLAVITFQFFFHPVDITRHIYRALLLPFLLGLLVPVFTFISYWSFRWHAPILATIIFVLAFMTADTADVRTTAKNAERPTLADAVERWEKANGCDHASTDPASKCPSPVIVSVAGGASRSAFLLSAVIGKLLDETKAKDGAKLRPFEQQLFAISGVSGGSLGASVIYSAMADSLRKGAPGSRTLGPPPCKSGVPDTEWFALQLPNTPDPASSWRACLELILSGDFLSPVMATLFSNDMFSITPRGDRAVILENAWERRYAGETGQDPATTTLAQPMSAVRQRSLETSATAWLPMLVLGGTSVTTGRRILTSDVDTLLSAEVAGLRGRLFRDAYDLHELLAPSSDIVGASFNPDGSRFLITYYGNQADIWDTKTGTIVRRMQLSDDVSGALWLPSGRILTWIHSFEKKIATVQNAETNETIYTMPAEIALDPVLSPTADRLLADNNDGLISIWNLATGAKLVEFTPGVASGTPTFSRDGRSILVPGTEDRALVFDAATGKLESEIPQFDASELGLGKARTHLVGTNSSEMGFRARVADLTTKKVIFDTGYDNRIAKFSPEGDLLVYAPRGGAIRIRNVRQESEIVVPRSTGDSWSDPMFTSDGRRVMVWDGEGAATIIDTATGSIVQVVRGQEGRVRRAVFHPSGHLALTISDNNLGRLWNLDTGKELYVIRGTHAGSGCDQCDVRLSTAATMSARFPVISPHGNIRNGHRLVDRVVDGGYYENFGALTALELTDALRAPPFNLDPRIVLINNSPEASAMSCITRDSQIDLPSPPAKILFAALRSPIKALYATGAARGTHAAVDLCSRIGGGDKFAFVTVVQDRRDRNTELSMSWWLSKHVQQYLDRQVDTDTTENNADAFRMIETWRRAK